MLWIAHRGNTQGPNPGEENKPDHIKSALSLGVDVEIDAWLVDGKFWLGHDAPKYQVDRDFLRNQRFWVHCKNAEALANLSSYPDVNCFYQEGDEATLTSRGYVWLHAGSKIRGGKTILVNLPYFDEAGTPPFGVCSDYPGYSDLFMKGSISRVPFDVLVVDVDGVMTDGKTYGLDGTVTSKSYCDLDFTAIKRFLSAGIRVVFLSGDMTVNMAMAKTRKVPFLYNVPGQDKADFLPEIRREYGKRVAYVGDDYYDIGIMCASDVSFCPRTSPISVRRAATHVIQTAAGKGVLAGVYDVIEKEVPYSFPKDSADVNP